MHVVNSLLNSEAYEVPYEAPTGVGSWVGADLVEVVNVRRTRVIKERQREKESDTDAATETETQTQRQRQRQRHRNTVTP